MTGYLAARGGPQGCDGGTIETSGASLAVSGIAVAAVAAHGKPDAWLLDPTDLIIDSALATSASGAPSSPVTLTGAERWCWASTTRARTPRPA